MDKLPVDFATAERLTLGIDQMTLLATSAQTGDALFAVALRMPPGGGPPVMHRHDPGELYYVIEGEFAFYTGGFWHAGAANYGGPGSGCSTRGRYSAHSP
jgi:quercetin dioxygenase-like cupin family protein